MNDIIPNWLDLFECAEELMIPCVAFVLAEIADFDIFESYGIDSYSQLDEIVTKREIR